jgi:hypothetical protein
MAAQIGPPAAAIRAHEELFAYWCSLRSGGSMPPRREVDPRGMLRLLPTVSLVDVLRGEDLDYRVRLAGTGLYSVYGREITGRRLSDIYAPTAAEYWNAELGRVVREGRPGVGVHSMAWRGASHLSLIWIRLPLSTTGAEVDMILGYDAVVGLSSVSSGIRAAPSAAAA